MPYINDEDKAYLLHLTSEIHKSKINSPGELNFLITKLCKHYLSQKSSSSAYKARYQDYNDVLGALEGSKLELYRRLIVPYEDTKIKENGDVY